MIVETPQPSPPRQPDTSPASAREHDLMWARLDKIEEKVDLLLNFRGWVLGVVAAISTGISTIVALSAVWFKTR